MEHYIQRPGEGGKVFIFFKGRRRFQNAPHHGFLYAMMGQKIGQVVIFRLVFSVKVAQGFLYRGLFGFRFWRFAWGLLRRGSGNRQFHGGGDTDPSVFFDRINDDRIFAKRIPDLAKRRHHIVRSEYF